LRQASPSFPFASKQSMAHAARCGADLASTVLLASPGRRDVGSGRVEAERRHAFCRSQRATCRGVEKALQSFESVGRKEVEVEAEASQVAWRREEQGVGEIKERRRRKGRRGRIVELAY
jgi:hypothetical protein